MNNDPKGLSVPQPQTAATPSGDPVDKPLGDGQAMGQYVQQTGKESEKSSNLKKHKPGESERAFKFMTSALPGLIQAGFA